MPFGITSASEVFQRAVEELFAGYPCAIVVDDLLEKELWSMMLILGKFYKEHEKSI